MTYYYKWIMEVPMFGIIKERVWLCDWQLRVLLHIQLNFWLENGNYTLLVVISCRHLGTIEACELK